MMHYFEIGFVYLFTEFPASLPYFFASVKCPAKYVLYCRLFAAIDTADL